MKKFIRLVNFEFERMSRFLFGILAALIGLEVVGSLVKSRRYMGRANDLINGQGYSTEQVINELGRFQFAELLMSMWVFIPVALTIVGFFFYIFFIWYREWWAKNTFAYRLLMLPVKRMDIYLSKLVVLLISLFTILAVQFGLFFVTRMITEAIVSETFYNPVPMFGSLEYSFIIFYPRHFTQFFLTYTAGAIVVMVIFTSIVIERSYGLKGWLLGGLYGFISLFLGFFPLFINDWFPFNFEFYTSEVVILSYVNALLIGVISYFVGRYFINHRITI